MNTKKIITDIEKIFKPLTFDDKRHIYFWYGEKVSKSVSAKVHEFEEEFDESRPIYEGGMTVIEASARKASRLEGREVTTHELRGRWHNKRDVRCAIGTETHYFLEMFQGLQQPRTNYDKAGVAFFKELFSKYIVTADGKRVLRYTILFRELRMYSKKYRFAGTADLILWDNLTQTVVIVDYKTNEDLFKVWKWLKSPFDFLESHPYNKYQIQLSLYQLIFEEMVGLKVSNRLLIHLKEDTTHRVWPLIDFTDTLHQYLQESTKETLW